ncbi:hypothetical protein PR003_g31214 [Phytophthora rubi]|uniref:Uncharacterized protein n=1 Tax=Phytophthora rubi TaxID=129364 RepID=A0A6A4BBG9_9STRA|nr:hypothetical protein PR001_g30385 [Phytophthora rubi]KAE8962300.1 hypothetical protein PR002_g29640 [Phytophthora rubi]KAE9269182.1 hypothetical protein PR003_g31214 [Phytophthora rubi]
MGMVPATALTPREVKRKQYFDGRRHTAERTDLPKGQGVRRKVVVKVPKK